VGLLGDKPERGDFDVVVTRNGKEWYGANRHRLDLTADDTAYLRKGKELSFAGEQDDDGDEGPEMTVRKA
jgi:hypothetical protein